MDTDKGKRLRSTSTIDGLPQNAREKLESMLTDQACYMTYKDMAAEMAADGYQISKSAICRYARRKMKSVNRVQQMQEQARILLDLLNEHPSADMARQLNALIQTGLMFRIAEGQEDIDDMSIEDAIKLSIQAQRAAVYEYRYHDQALVREEKSADDSRTGVMDALRETLRERPELTRLLSISGEIKASETPDGLDSSPDGRTENI